MELIGLVLIYTCSIVVWAGFIRNSTIGLDSYDQCMDLFVSFVKSILVAGQIQI